MVSDPFYDWINELTSLGRTKVRTSPDFMSSPKMIPLAAEAVVLNSFCYARQAEYRHGDRNGCLKGTRSAVLDEIELWACDFDKPPVYWLNGIAGTGKTTIAQTIAERMFAQGLLGASFFCSRDFEDRRNIKLIIPTLAVQLARTYPEFRSVVVPLVRSDPEIAHESLYGQMSKLIVQPLVKSAISTVIVIDALDECRDREPSSAILSILRRFVTEIPRAKFFVTGRPEPHIREGFRLLLLAEATDTFVLHEVEPSRVNSDVRLFFRHNFSELKERRRILGGWPTEEQLNLLCERAAGFFVYAMATIRFAGQNNKNPKKQLDRLLQSSESGFEGRAELRENMTLDSLYLSILQEAFGDHSPEDGPDIRSVLGSVILATNPLSPSTIATLLGFDVEDVFPLLSSLHSLLVLQEDIHHPIQPFHESFPDFIINPARCTNPRFYICPSDQHAQLLVGCLKLMNQRLERNICKLPDGVTNLEVDDLKERTEKYIDKALEYACRSWHQHLFETRPVQVPTIIPILHQFLDKKFLFWLEVLSVLGAVRGAVDALEVTAKLVGVCCISSFTFLNHSGLIQVSPTLDLAKDYSRFVIAFFEVISASAPHIYHSALTLSPKMSMVYKKYKQYMCPLAWVVCGLPPSWKPIVATRHCEGFGGKAAWSPCNMFVAVAKPGAVEVCDARTLNLYKTFQSSLNFMDQQLFFSLDSRFLTQFGDGSLVTWDLQTGCSVSAILPGTPQADNPNFSSTYSIDGKMFAVIYTGQYPKTTITTLSYSMTSTHIQFIPEGRMVSPIWTHDEFIQFATVKSGYITIWELKFTLTHTPEVVEEFLLAPVNFVDTGVFRVSLFLPMVSRLALGFHSKLLVWGVKDSKVLLNMTPFYPTYISFSSDGCFFACMSTDSKEVYVWKETPTGYVLHQKLTFATLDWDMGLHLSPNGESIIVSLFTVIQLWHTKDPIHSSHPAPATNRFEFILRFSPNEELAAFTRLGKNTVMIFGLQSGDQQLEIDLGVEVECFALTGSTIIVVGGGKIVAWSLATRNTRLNIYNSSHITTLDLLELSYRQKYLQMSISPDLSYVVILGHSTELWSKDLKIYDVATGRCLAATTVGREYKYTRGLWFTPDGCEIWDADFMYSPARRWRIIGDRESGIKRLQPVEITTLPPGVFPWRSAHGYKVTNDSWVLNSTHKRLLWLPHHWRSQREECRTWSGRFLGLGHRELPEVVILEFLE